MEKLPSPPYYAVIFTSVKTGDDTEAYSKMADAMEELATQQEVVPHYWTDLRRC